MNFGSVCSGIEAASVAWKPLGWRCAFTSEIESFPCALLQYHHPESPNLGDMTKFKEWPDAAIDVLVGGTPCQSFSVAGLRKGLADPRGNLCLTYLAIADRYRPEWLVWENVPGVLSSGGGRDFGAFLGGLGQLGYGFAYRVLDAQYFGVAQRRRRVFVVANARSWRRAAAVLFERSSLRGDPAPSREAGQRAAASLTGGSNPHSNAADRRREDDVNLVANPLGAKKDGGWRGDLDNDTYAVTHSLRAEGFDASEDGTGRGIPLTVGTMKACANSSGFSNSADHAAAGYMVPEIANPLTARMHKGVNTTMDEGQTMIPLSKVVAFTGGASDVLTENDMAQPVTGRNGDPGMVAFAQNQRDEVRELAVAGALAGEPGMKQQTCVAASAVRRLTPRECERLQGFPDDYTLIPYRGKSASDGPRYKALGNSMAVPVMRWIGERIQQVHNIPGGSDD